MRSEYIGSYEPVYRKVGRTDWRRFEFTPQMIEAAQKHADDHSVLWAGLRESGYLNAALAAGGGEIA